MATQGIVTLDKYELIWEANPDRVAYNKCWIIRNPLQPELNKLAFIWVNRKATPARVKTSKG